MNTLRVATWNIRKAVGLDRRRRPERVLGAIAALGADVVALQEADRRFGDRPSALPDDRILVETGLMPVPVDRGRSLGWHGNAILMRPEFSCVGTELVALPGFEPRGALVADLVRGDAKFRIVSVHLGLARRHRRLQLASLSEILEALPDSPTVILGDFNEWSEDRGLETLSPEFRVHAPGPSFHASRPVGKLDRIAHNGQLTLVSAGVQRSPLSDRASDHLPVWGHLMPTI